MQTESPFSLAFTAAERELGQRIGFPALVYENQEERSAPADAEARAIIEALLSVAETARDDYLTAHEIAYMNGNDQHRVDMAARMKALRAPLDAARAWLGREGKDES